MLWSVHRFRDNAERCAPPGFRLRCSGRADESAREGYPISARPGSEDKADGKAEATAYREYVECCDDVFANTRHNSKTATSQNEELEAKLTADQRAQG